MAPASVVFTGLALCAHFKHDGLLLQGCLINDPSAPLDHLIFFYVVWVARMTDEAHQKLCARKSWGLILWELS
jgi:hypothetical protein